ncbi:MAG TPA: hypothetical protein DCX70_01340 [Chitinophagaceae bacterium]|nr:hypothetical protein [Chitinophagaceae bacterium]
MKTNCNLKFLCCIRKIPLDKIYRSELTHKEYEKFYTLTRNSNTVLPKTIKWAVRPIGSHQDLYL